MAVAEQARPRAAQQCQPEQSGYPPPRRACGLEPRAHTRQRRQHRGAVAGRRCRRRRACPLGNRRRRACPLGNRLGGRLLERSPCQPSQRECGRQQHAPDEESKGTQRGGGAARGERRLHEGRDERRGPGAAGDEEAGGEAVTPLEHLRVGDLDVERVCESRAASGERCAARGARCAARGARRAVRGERCAARGKGRCAGAGREGVEQEGVGPEGAQARPLIVPKPRLQPRARTSKPVDLAAGIAWQEAAMRPVAMPLPIMSIAVMGPGSRGSSCAPRDVPQVKHTVEREKTAESGARAQPSEACSIGSIRLQQ